MTVLRTLKKLVLGETWLLPLGIGAVVGLSLLLQTALGDGWDHLGGFVILAGVAFVLVLSVSLSARQR